MPQSLSKVYLHIVFSTKERVDLITADIEQELYSYMGGTIKGLGGIPIRINGMPNHVHILCTLPRTVSVARYLEEIKRSSSKWIKTKDSRFNSFAWQGGYGVFSVSESQTSKVASYIDNQKEHHKKSTFKEEFKAFLDLYEIDYDQNYLWD